MLETLNDEVFAALEDAYGPAVDVPGRLRDLVTADRNRARALIGDLGAGIFHQGSYFDSTAPTIPFLIELAAADIPARAEVLNFLAAMGGGDSDPDIAFQPFIFRSTPGLPDYPDAVRTIEAIHLGAPVYLEALQAPDANARACAAHLLAGLGCLEAIPILERALEGETAPTTRLALHFALSRLGGRAGTEEQGVLADVARVLRCDATPDDATLDALGRLLLEEKSFGYLEMPFFGGDLVSFAASTLARADHPRAFDVAADAIDRRFARGERVQELPGSFTRRVGDGDEVTEGDASRAKSPKQDALPRDFSDTPLRAIAAAMTRHAFGARADAPELLRRSELDARRRRVLALTRDHGLPVPVRGAPWFDARAMRRFLTGGGPLDAEIEVAGERVPLFVRLTALAQSDDVAREGDAPFDAIFAPLTRTLSDASLVELAIDILGNGYGMAEYGAPRAEVARAIDKHLAPAAMRRPEQRADYAASLLKEPYVTRWQAQFALGPEIEARRVPEERFDPLVKMAITDHTDRSRAWLAAFPEPRRSRIVGSLGNAYLIEMLEEVCDPKMLEREILKAFLAPGCPWDEHAAERLLGWLPDTEELEALLTSSRGVRRAILGRVVGQRTRTGLYRLEMLNQGEGVRATLFDGFDRVLTTATLSRVPRTEELVPIVSLLSQDVSLRMLLAGDLDDATEYRVMRLLPEAGFRGTIQSNGGTTLTAADPAST